MNLLAKKNEPNLLKTRILNQAARELLLAQSSDWAFIMKTGTVSQYAVKRTKEHLRNFHDLLGLCDGAPVSLDKLQQLEERNAIFPEIDYRIFA